MTAWHIKRGLGTGSRQAALLMNPQMRQAWRDLAIDYDWTPPPHRKAELIDLAESRKALDATYEVDEEVPTYRAPSTPETKARYAFLKSKKLGETWEENGRLYRQGPCGVTVYKPECFG